MDFKEWEESKVDRNIITLNVRNLQGNSAYEYLLYGLDNSERINTGRLREKWLKRYNHLDDGGWWCGGGIDLTTLNGNALVNQRYGQETDWGCFKPNAPKRIDGKLIKYEHPPRVGTEIFALKINRKSWLKIGENLSVSVPTSSKIPIGVESTEIAFWQWVIDSALPIIITEGAKKAGALLSAGYIAIALPGVNSGYRSETGELIEQLKPLCRPGREIVLCFDQDPKWTTRIRVNQAIKKLGELFQEQDCTVTVVHWEPELGKGVDDFIAVQGDREFKERFDSRLLLDEFLEKYDTVRSLKNRTQVLTFFKEHLEKRLAYNELTQRVELDGESLDLSGELSYRMIEDFRVEIKSQALIDGILYCAKKNTYHPVQRYLKACYAQKEFISLDNLSSRYLGTSDPFYDLLVKKWMIGAVARVLEPVGIDSQGAKVDFALVLQGQRHGAGKTSFFEILGGPFYDSSFGSNLESVKALMVLHRCWIQEWGELERVVGKREAGEVKDFVTKRSDTYVSPYGREALPHPRRFIMCGTTNKLNFLKDETGDRRFLVVPIADSWDIPLTKLKEERDLIWASAVKEYLEGKERGENVWVMNREEQTQLNQANRMFREHDEWESIIENFIEEQGLTRVSAYRLLSDTRCLGITPDRVDTRSQNRVTAALIKLGYRSVAPCKETEFDGKRRRLWEKIDSPQTHPINTDTADTGGVSEKVVIENPCRVDVSAHEPPSPDPQTHASDTAKIGDVSRGVSLSNPVPIKDLDPQTHQTRQNQQTFINQKINEPSGPRFKEGDLVEYENLITHEFRTSKVRDVFSDATGECRYHLADGTSRWESQLRGVAPCQNGKT